MKPTPIQVLNYGFITIYYRIAISSTEIDDVTN